VLCAIAPAAAADAAAACAAAPLVAAAPVIVAAALAVISPVTTAAPAPTAFAVVAAPPPAASTPLAATPVAAATAVSALTPATPAGPAVANASGLRDETDSHDKRSPTLGGAGTRRSRPDDTAEEMEGPSTKSRRHRIWASVVLLASRSRAPPPLTLLLHMPHRYTENQTSPLNILLLVRMPPYLRVHAAIENAALTAVVSEVTSTIG